MFCVMCSMLKAETGCYAQGCDNRICLQCYMNMVGNYPLPGGAAPSLGGAFADGKALAKSFKESANNKKEDVMEKVSKTIAIEAGGFQQDLGEVRQAVREQKEAFWKEMPEDVQKYRNNFNKKIDGVNKKIDGVVDEAKETANSVLQSIGDLF